MQLIPAIDIYKNRCLRLTQGNFKKKTYISKNYLLNKINNKHYNRIHIIDLEGAKSGKVKNLNTVIKLARQIRKANPNIKIQSGGGIRNISHIKTLISENIEVILSTTLLTGNQLINIKNYIKHLILSIDYKQNKVFIKGWQQEHSKLTHLINAVNTTNLPKVIFTDINRDGTRKGINKTNITKIIKRVCKKKKIMFAGGLNNTHEFKNLTTCLKTTHIYGIIGGKFLF
ncbi:hypothetical protein JSR02_00410 [Candidatus Vidania fulgoroideae]|uniref:1-(5-phosphoribosyl)-5-((5-phosphoribosylamino)methylideneamino)imidazole-4-carboxamide isomerase n=1 Tax=Candidatus Vidania fulgoroideorum TaxID=881286 RepID=A0A974XDK0_9PROT|nr:hypothetical protein JSR02_00410 [Candidatus Vidania fulgoroideae]